MLWDLVRSCSPSHYRLDTPEPVRLAGRGHELGELDGTFTDWNARITEDGRVVPDVAVG